MATATAATPPTRPAAPTRRVSHRNATFNVWDSLVVGGVRRQFLAFYPPIDRDPNGLAILLHVLGATASNWCRQEVVRELTREGVLVVCPQAMERKLHGPDGADAASTTYWRAFAGHGYGFDAHDGTEDLDFLDAIKEWAASRAVVPASRAFLFGCSAVFR